MKVLTVSITEAGRAVAARLPYERTHGSMGPTLRSRWHDVDAFVCCCAVGVVARVAGPLARDKHTDPAVVCVDEAARWVVPVLGGHAGGANDLALEVAARLGATAVVTTATDASAVPALDQLDGFRASGDVAGVTRALLDGEPVDLVVDEPLAGWPLPPRLPLVPRIADATVPGPPGPGYRVVVSDRTAVTGAPGVAVLRPPSLVVGVGASTDASGAEAVEAVRAALGAAGLSPAAVAEVATLDRRAGDPAVLALGLPVRSYPAERLATVAVPTPSPAVRHAVGTPSVAEAAALVAGGSGAALVVPKRAARRVTVAVARRARPRGRLSLVGLGPGAPAHRTAAAEAAVRSADVVVGYSAYLDLARDLLGPGQEVLERGIGDEVVRAKEAVAEAEAGRTVALVCSGDAGVYGMASLVGELAEHLDADLEVVPGVTAATAAAALLGAPLGHDFVVVSLSDLLTPWDVVASRLDAAGRADLVTVLYNPRSAGRPDHLARARDILLRHRLPATPVGIVTDAFRPGQRVALSTLGDLDPTTVGMTTTVIVGSSATRVTGGRMVTPRGYTP